jgi:hypothetical protein
MCSFSSLLVIACSVSQGYFEDPIVVIHQFQSVKRSPWFVWPAYTMYQIWHKSMSTYISFEA